VRRNTHPGFEAVARSIAKWQGTGVEHALAELAVGTLWAGEVAHKANLPLNCVKIR
jgi:hypothetical protein